MAKRDRLGSLYTITDLSVFEWLDGFQPGDIVQVVNPPGIRPRYSAYRTGAHCPGKLRHVRRLSDQHIGFCNIEYLEPYRAH